MTIIRISIIGAALLLGACSSTQTHTITVNTGTQFGATGDDTAIYIDMQGILWKLPPGGGTAVALTDASDDLRRPQLSPDGTKIVAQSFAAGHWDIVLLDTDGSNKRYLTQSTADDQEPAWSRDGYSVLFSSDRSGNEDIWLVDAENGDLKRLTNHPANDYAPGATNDGFVFVSDRDSQSALFRQSMGSAPEQLAVAPGGRMYAARMNPNGERIAWVQATERNGFPGVARNELVHLNLETKVQQALVIDPPSVFGMAPTWLDEYRLLISAYGRLVRADVHKGTGTVVPFAASLDLQRDKYKKRTPLAFKQSAQPMLGIVDPIALPDDSIAFTALSDLWVLDSEAQLTRLTDDPFVERDLALSPDGKTLAYISERDGSMQIWSRDIASGTDTRLTEDSTGPRYPTFSPDGTRIAYQQVGPLGTQDFTVRVLDLATGESTKLRSSPQIWPGRMAWSADGESLVIAELHRIGRASDGRNRLVRINVDADEADVVQLAGGITPDSGPVASPDGRSLALVIDGKLHSMPISADGLTAGKPVQIFAELVESPAWMPDGKRLLALGPDGLMLVDPASGDVETRNPDRHWQPAAGQGRRLIHAGRVWDGESDTYIRDVDILIDGARIVSVKPHKAHPAEVSFIDASEHTVLPGLIDHHVHFEGHKGEWVGRALLAFGVTTVVEPGGLPYESREHMESWLSGQRTGPRLVFSGPQLDGARRTFHFASHINSEERLQQELERGKRLGYGLIKTYRRLPPDLQQQTVELSHDRGWPVTAHAGLRNIGFGGDRTEHLRGSSRTSYSPKQSDLLESFADIEGIYLAPGASVTPTIINQGGFFDVALGQEQAFADIRQYQALFPPAYRTNLEGFTRVVERKIDLVRAGLQNAGATVQTIDSQGGNVVAGTDSPIFPYGLSLIIELQNYVDAGLSNAAALRTATVNAAEAMGASKQVGTIKQGMLADLVIVNGDPLTSITDLYNVQGVILNGRYQTLGELLE